MSKFVSAYSAKNVVKLEFPEDESGAKQQFKDECDINKIMSRYQKTGLINHVNNHSAQYGAATSQDFRESMELITNATQMFNDLPSKTRRRFGNSPEAFLEFMETADGDQLIEMGMAEPKHEIKEELDSEALDEPQKDE